MFDVFSSQDDDFGLLFLAIFPVGLWAEPSLSLVSITFLCINGVLTALPSASLNEWRQHYSATYEQLSRTFAVDGVGVVLGALLSTGSMCCRDSSSGDGMIGVAMVMMMTYPCFHSIDYLLASSLVFGVGKGLLLVGGIWLIFRLWGDVTARAGVFVQLLYIANAVGSFAGLHLAAPYLRHVFRFIGSSDGCLATTSSPRDVTSNASFDTTDFSLNVTASPPTAVNYTGKTGFVCFTTEKRFPLLYTPVMSFNLLLAVFFFLCSFRFCFEARKLCRREATRSRRKRKKCVRKARTSAVDNNYTSTDLPPTILDFKRSDQILHIAEVQETSKTREDGTGVEWIGDDVDEYAEVDEPSKRNQKIVFNEVSMLKVSQSDDGGSSPEKKFTRPIRSWFRDGQKLDVPVLMFFYVYFFLPHGVETMIGRFVGVYADRSRTLHESAPLDPRQLLLSVFWASVILGRLLTVAASRFLPATWLTVIFITLQLTASTAVFIYGDRSEVVLWLFVAVYGCVLGPVLPGGLTWCNAFLDQSTARPHALAVSAAGLGGALMSWLGGIVVDYVGARWLWAVASAVAAISGILSVPVVTSLESARVRRRHQRRPRSTYV